MDVIQTVNRPVIVERDVQSITVVERGSAANVTVDRNEIDIVERLTRTVEVIDKGPKGDKGDTGSSASGLPPIDFSYGDASSAIFTPSQSGTITLARISIEVAFDGASPRLKLGTIFSPEAFLASAQNDPTSVGEYENTPDLAIAANQSVFFTITPGAGATQGSGSVLLTFIPD